MNSTMVAAASNEFYISTNSYYEFEWNPIMEVPFHISHGILYLIFSSLWSSEGERERHCKRREGVSVRERVMIDLGRFRSSVKSQVAGNLICG